MKNNSIWKRITSITLATVMMFNMLPLNVFAAQWENTLLKEQRNEEVSFEELVDKLVDDKTAPVRVTVTVDVNGTDVQATVDKTSDEDVDFFVGTTGSDTATGVAFATGGDYALIKGTGTVSGTMNSAAQAEYDNLKAAAEAADSETSAAQSAVTSAAADIVAKEAAALVPKGEKELAEYNYNSALEAENAAQASLDAAITSLDNLEATVEAKKQEIADQQAALAEERENLQTLRNTLSSLLSTAGFDSVEALRAEIDRLKNKSSLNIGEKIKLAAYERALPTIENTLADIASKEAEIRAEEAVLAQKQLELENMDEEAVKALIQQDIDNAEAALAAAKAETATKKAAVDAAQVKVDAAEAEIAQANQAYEAANNALAQKEDAEAALWQIAADYITSLTADQVEFNPADVQYTAGTESYAFTVKVYDKLTVSIVDEQGSMSSLPQVTVNSDAIGENVYKLFEGESVTMNVPSVPKYRYSVEGAEGENGSYTVNSVSADKTVVVKYTEIGASSISFTNPEGAEIIVKTGDEVLATGANVKAGTTLSVKVEPATGYTVTELTVTNMNGNPVELTDGCFVTSTTEENAYTVSAKTEFTGSVVTTGAMGSYVESVSMTANGAPYAAGNALPTGDSEITVVPATTAGFTITKMYVLTTFGDDESFEVEGENNFTFTAKSGCKYEVSFSDEAVEDIRSTVNVTPADGAVIVVTAGSQKLTVPGENGLSLGQIVPGTKIEIKITPDADNTFVSSYDVTAEGGVVALNNEKTADSVVTFEFTAGTLTEYTVSAVVAEPVLAVSDNQVVLNKFDVRKMHKGDAEAEAKLMNDLWSAFTTAADITVNDVEFKYSAAQLDLTSYNLGVVDLWLSVDVDEDEVSFDGIVELLSESLNVNKTIVKMALNLIGAENIMSSIKGFAEDEGEVLVQATYTGDTYDKISAETTVTVQDLRAATELNIAEMLDGFVYGNFTAEQVLAAAIVDGGVYADGERLADKYQSMLTITMEDMNAGEKTAVIKFPGDDDYKDSKAEIVVNVEKADVKISMTTNNVILYNSLPLVTKDYLMTVTPDVQFEDTVGHISFLAGIELNLNEDKAPALFATIDLSQLGTVVIAGYEVPASKEIIDTIINLLDPDNDGMSLTDLIESIGDISDLLPSDEGDIEIDEDMLSAAINEIYALLGDYAKYAEVYIKLANDPQAVVPSEHGAYIVGAVTTDANYNTAVNGTYLIVTAKPVTVKFDNENAEFVYDGSPKELTVSAYAEDGSLIPGEATVLYAGIQSDASTYLSTDAPVHTGVYAATAIYHSDMWASAGLAFTTMTIWPSNEAKVDVLLDTEDQIIRTYTGNPFDVMEMIDLKPAGTDAKLAVITASIADAGDFSEQGWAAVEANINIDFPARADQVLRSRVPSAYSTGITKADLLTKIAEIKTAVAEYCIDTAMVDQIVSVISQIPEGATITFHEQAQANPVDIGVFVIAAVVFDPDYIPAMDSGILVVVPDTTRETLEWNYNDKNGIYTQPALSIVDMGAKTVVDVERSDRVFYTFIGIDKTGAVSVINTDTANLKDTASALANGVYTQVAYLIDEVSHNIGYAKPIARVFAVVPQLAEITFGTLSSDNNGFTFTYTGNPVEMTANVVKADGSQPKDECLKLRYTGIDSTGAEYDSYTAPVNAGKYTVTATYLEYDAHGALTYAAMNLCEMTILPAQGMIKVEETDTVCGPECLCECVQYSEVVCDETTDCPCHRLTLEERGIISKVAGDFVITVTTDSEGNTNVILPEEWEISAVETTVENLLEMIKEKGEETGLDMEKVAEVIKEALAEVESVSVNNEENYPCGVTTITAVVFGANHITASATATMTTRCYDPYKGTFGENITWYLDSDGILHVIGEGAMDNTVVDGDARNVPWYRVKDKIKAVEMSEEITTIADFAFADCPAIETITLHEGITEIGENAFRGGKAFSKLKLPVTLKTISAGAFADCTGLEYMQIFENVEFIDDTAFDNVDRDIPVYVYYNDYAVEVLTAMGFTNIIIVDYDKADITLDRYHLMAVVGTTDVIVAQSTYPVEINWYTEGDSVTVEGDGYNGTFTAVQPGTTYIVASGQFGSRTVYARCRVDATAELPVGSISGAHLPTQKVTSNIYSTDNATFDVIFDLHQNMNSTLSLFDMMVSSSDEIVNNGIAVESAYFTDSKVAQLFSLKVLDDKTLEIVPVMDVNDSKVVKSVKGSYKSTVTVVVNGEEITTTEKLTIKTSKKLPSVKAKAVKLNSFYTDNTQPLVFTGKNVNVVSAEVNEAKATKKTPAIPTWLKLNDDLTVTHLTGTKTKASGKMYLKVMVEGYRVPVAVTVSVSVASTAPKMKLSPAKVTFYTERELAGETTIRLMPSDKKATFASLGVTDIKVADISTLSSKNQKTYAASKNYAVTAFDPVSGDFVLDVAEGMTAVSGKVMLEVAVAGAEKTVTLPVTVSAYSKAPTIKLAKSTLSVYSVYADKTDSATTKLNVSPADFIVDNSNLSWIITDSKNNQLDNDVLNVSYENGNVTVKSTEKSAAGKYKVVFTAEGAAKPVTLTVNVKAASLKAAKTSVTLNKALNDSVVISLKTTPADYVLSTENLSWEIKSATSNGLGALPLTVSLEGNNLKIATNQHTAFGTTYSVVLKLAETGKTVTIKVKTITETKSVAKVSLSVKGKLQTAYLDKEVVVTAKWTNLAGGADITENIRVYATAKAKGSQPVDVTDKFTVTRTADNKYSVRFKDLDSLYELNPTDKYTVAVKGATVNDVEIADSKAAKVTFSLSKVKMVQSVKKVSMYKNDRYSQGEVKITTKDKTVPSIEKVVLIKDKVGSFYQLKNLGDNEYAICYAERTIGNKIKNGTVKLDIYLEGNNPEFGKPNATVKVSVKNVAFKTAK